MEEKCSGWVMWKRLGCVVSWSCCWVMFFLEWVSVYLSSPGLGNDAYNAMMMALSDVVGIPYARFFAIFSVGLFVIELIAGRHFIGLGTIINTLFLGYIATFFYNIWDFVFTKPGVLLTRIPVMVIGVIICSLGVSMYQRPDVGVSAIWQSVTYHGWEASEDILLLVSYVQRCDLRTGGVFRRRSGWNRNCDCGVWPWVLLSISLISM